MPGQRVKILLVDDQPARIQSYQAILGDLGHDLVAASSGEAALHLLSRDEFALVLLDVSLPVVDGFQTATRIHRHPRLENTPIVFVTTVEHPDLDRLRAYQLGPVDHVFAPVVPVILRTKVARLVELHLERRALQDLNESLRTTNLDLTEANSALRAERARELEQFAHTLETKNAELAQANEVLRAQARERQRAEEALRASEGRLRAILQNASALIYQTDLEGRFVHVNRVFEELLERPSAEILGRSSHELFPADVAAELQANDRLVLERGQSLEFEERLPVHGETHTYRSTKAPFLDDAGVLRGVVGVSTDVTERKRLVEELQLADRRKDEFLAVLAHELRNPLAPIAAASQILRQRSLPDEELAWCRDVIERQTELLTRLVDDLLDISRISYGKINLRREVLDLSDLVARTVETSRPFFDERGQELSVSLPGRPLYVRADPVRLGQVFSNLLSNAAKYSDNGRLTRLVVEEATHNGRADPGEVLLRVKDEGIGISAEFLPHVFDLFTQGKRALTRTHGGLGVGLALVHRLVTLHGGTVTVHSPGPGQGTEFAVRLPLCAERKELFVVVPAEDAPRAERPHRVLIVDDNVDSAIGLSMILRHSGHDVRVSHDGFSALREAEAFRPKVALLDIGMPEMDGCDLAQRIRQLPFGDRTVLVAMTGWSQEETRARILEAGFDLHMVKPLDGLALGKTIATLVATHPRLRPS